jgi:hypothetical protein
VVSAVKSGASSLMRKLMVDLLRSLDGSETLD